MSKRRSRRSTPKNWFFLLLGLLSMLFLFVYQLYVDNPFELGNISATPVPPVRDQSPGSTWYSLYFTDPSLRADQGGPDEPLAAAIRAAQRSVDVAIYSLSLDSIRDALLDADRRGVNVRMVVESDNSDNRAITLLRNAGIQILGDRREGLMHNKFVIIDGQEVWTGSMNFTPTGTYADHNHLIRLRSVGIASNYTVEFEEMFLDDQFGAGSPAITPYPLVTVDSTQIQVFFSPDDGVSGYLESLLLGAQESIYFLAYSFTADPLSEAVLERSQMGVTVAGVFDEEQAGSNIGGDYDFLRSAGLDVRLDSNPGQMHHKVMIVDERVVVLGSYNFSASAETRNDENLLIVSSPELAGLFMDEFERIYEAAKK